MSLVSASTIPRYVLRYRSHAMDGVYSIVAGLVLRVVVDAATFHNMKLSGTLVGLWEGVVLLHYVNKAPRSSDPYLAYSVRLFVDFLFTESIFRAVIVMLWSTMGMVLADVAPAVWVEFGLKRHWSRIRRDVYRGTRIFSRRRTVRFVSAPTIAPTIASTARSTVSSVDSSSSVGDAESTVATTVFPPSTTASRTVPPDSPTMPTIPMAPVHRPIAIRRRSSVPGTFPGAALSETDTDAGTVVDADEEEDEDEDDYEDEEDTPAPMFPSQSSHVTISRIIPFEPSEGTYTFTTSPRSSSPAYSLEYSDDPSATNPVDIPSELEEEILVLSHGRRGSDDRETTPKQMIIVLPPTPTESLRDWESSHGEEEVPPSPWMPLIPDHEPLEEWETVNPEEEVPPPPPPKDADSQRASVSSDDASVSTGSTTKPIPHEATAPTENHDAPSVDVSIPAPLMPLSPITAPTALPGHAPSLITFSPIVIPVSIPDSTPPTTIPVPDTIPPGETSQEHVHAPPQTALGPPSVSESDAPHNSVPELDAPQDPLATVPEPDAAQYLSTAFRTPPPSFEDLYGSEVGQDAELEPEPEPEPVADAPTDAPELPESPIEPPASHHGSRPATPPVPSPSGSISRALGLRKEALEIRARIASLERKRKSSLVDGGSMAAAVLAKVEMERAEKELAEVNEKAAGAFIGAYNPPSASLYEFNTTGLTPDEAVLQTEARLEKLLLTPVPPVGTRPEDLVHDSPNRGALKVVMEQTIKGRLVKQKLLAALNGNGLNWFEETGHPNVVCVLLPVSAAADEPPASAAAKSEPPPKANEDEDDAKEY